LNHILFKIVGNLCVHLLYKVLNSTCTIIVEVELRPSKNLIFALCSYQIFERVCLQFGAGSRHTMHNIKISKCRFV